MRAHDDQIAIVFSGEIDNLLGDISQEDMVGNLGDPGIFKEGLLLDTE